MSHTTILLSAIKPGISAEGGALEVLVRVQALDAPTEAHATITPKRLALVVDRSGSMDGQPVTEALRCVTHIADSMRNDSAGDQALAVGQQDDLEHDTRVIGTGTDFIVLETGIQGAEVKFVVYQVIQCEGKAAGDNLFRQDYW